jgi:hypothetical protein
MTNNLKIILKNIRNRFNKFILSHKQTFIKQVANDSPIESSVDYSMKNMLSARNVELVEEINLLTYYSLAEVVGINEALGLPEENTTLTEQLLDDIYTSRVRSPELNEVYHLLKWRLFNVSINLEY